MILQVNFGSAQTGVNFQFYGIVSPAQNFALLSFDYMDGAGNSRSDWPRTEGIDSPLPGLHLVNVHVPSNVAGVVWKCDDPARIFTEDLTARFVSMPFNQGIRRMDARCSSLEIGFAEMKAALTSSVNALPNRISVAPPRRLNRQDFPVSV